MGVFMKIHNILCVAFMLFATSAQAGYSIARMPDGSVHISGCRTQTIGNTDYLCCDDNCQTEDYWIKRAYSNVEVDYMKDVREREAVDRYTMTRQNIDMSEVENEDDTPALGKAQNKLNELGHELFNAIGF